MADTPQQVLRIVDWDEHFENNRSRDLKRTEWVPVPNKHDGDGYTTLVDHPDGAAHYGAWLAILQVASRCDIRGTLLRSNRKPHTAASIARLTRLPAAIIEEAMKRLISDEIGWIELVDLETLTPIPQVGAGETAGGCGRAPMEEKRTEGTEEKKHDHKDIDSKKETGDAHCEGVRRRANEMLAKLGLGRPKERADVMLVLEACTLVESGEMSEGWLTEAIEGTRLRKTQPGNIWAYFRTILQDKAHAQGVNFGMIMDGAEVPPALLPPDPDELTGPDRRKPEPKNKDADDAT